MFTTTDPISIEYHRGKNTLLLTDTAGIHKKSEDESSLTFSNFSLNVIKISDMVIFMTDIYNYLSRYDKNIISLIIKLHKPIILVINKVDLLSKKKCLLQGSNLKYLELINPHLISALNRKNVVSIIDKALHISEVQSKKIDTSVLNEVFLKVMSLKKHPIINGKELKLYFVKQVSQKPLCFIIIVNVLKHQIKKTYEKYLKNNISRMLNIKNIPVKLIFIKKK